MVDENVPLVTDGIVLEVTRRQLATPRIFIGIEKEIPIKELMGGTETSISYAAKLWNEFHEIKPKIHHLIEHGNEFGALYIGNAKRDTVPIWQAPKSNMELLQRDILPSNYLLQSILYADLKLKALRS